MTKRFERLGKELREKEEKEQNKILINQMRNEILSLKEDLEKAQEGKEEADRNRSMLHKLFENNVIDEDG